jgi:hypothetical protein
MEQPIVPLELRELTPGQLRQQLEKYHWREVGARCPELVEQEIRFGYSGAPANEKEIKRREMLTICFQNYWQNRINAEFGDFRYIVPNYPNNYHDYLAIRVQRNVAQILLLEQYANVSQKRIDDAMKRFESLPIAGTTETTLYEEEVAKEEREIIKLSSEAEEIYQDARSASIILASVIFEICQVCRSILFPVSQNQRPGLERLLSELKGTHSIEQSEEGHIFHQQFIAQRFHMSDGNMIVFHFIKDPVTEATWKNQEPEDWPDYIMFMNEGVFTIAGPYLFRNPRVSRNLPNHFVRYLRQKGLIAQVAVELYPVMSYLPLAPEHHWL